MKPPLPIQPTRRTPDDGRKVVTIIVLSAVVTISTLATGLYCFFNR